ncbi:hypothetical protein TVH25_00190 [Rhodococcus sp. 7Tela_A2]|uniref:hypothetical protein n=1 Tax=Rhodococcus sp. 7Tela_A2 TaxID=3093744 RepID=UPI003BB71A58
MTDDAATPEIATWEGMGDWLVTSFTDQPTGLIIDLGPNTYLVYDDEENESGDDRDEVVCAQVHVLSSGVLMVRRSRTMLDRLRFDYHSVEELELDQWFFDDHFDDCTDGYMFTVNVGLAADACVSWFRDMRGAPVLDDIGCDYEYPATLPSRHSA